MSEIALSLRIRGRVQGVWYRASAQREATRLGLRGYVRNEEDGSVSAHVQGVPPLVEAFVEWCHEGPMLARVDRVDREETEPGPYTAFEVRQ